MNFHHSSAILDGNGLGMDLWDGRGEGLETRGEKWLLHLIGTTAMTPFSHQGIVHLTVISLSVTTRKCYEIIRG